VTRPLRVGVQLPEVEREVAWPEYVAMAHAAEQVGFDSIWIGDHLLYRGDGRPERGPWEAWTLLSGLAAVTERVKLGPLVACASFHPPGLIAKMASTLDEISGGRFVLGLGAGWNETEFRAYGYAFDHRIDRFEEAFTIIRTLLTDGAIDFDGRYYQARDCELSPLGPTPGGPPLLIGSNGERMLRITLPHVRAWNSWFNATRNSPAGVADLRAKVDAACADVGRDPTEVERSVAVYVRLSGGGGRVQGTSEPLPPALEGNPETMAAELRAYADEGIDEVQLVMDPIDSASIEEFARVLDLLDPS
jgi:alkanesulfonate monooxygenase SsuD/methylene tetrahydromethanopterin reductase-like flavin-dependent oxidoreductase (luciferase family)